MDRITSGLLGEFTKEFELTSIGEDKQFEHFSTYVKVRKHYSDSTFDPSALVTGDGNDTGIDGIAIIVNNNIVDEIDEVDELLSVNGFLDVTFVFIQAERSSNFEGGKIGTFGFGVRDFFGKGTLVKNDKVSNARAIMNAIFNKSAKFTKGNPNIVMYYVTTGKWQGDHNLISRYESEVNYLRDTGNFRAVSFVPIGADQVQQLYYYSKNAITREFLFERKTVIPNITNVTSAYLGFLNAKDFLKIIVDENGDIIESLFYDNVRGYEGYNDINSEIRETLTSAESDRFVLMNNGVTIIAKGLLTTGDKFTMNDFQIVNGCQTSNVLFDNRNVLSDTVRIPVRIICTTDEGVAEAVITATNRQTEVKEEQFFALKQFAKKLEAFFKSFDILKRLYYERRAHQYDSSNIEKTRIIPHKDLVRAVGAMFFQEPHRTTRSYKALASRVGRDMFLSTDKAEPYYIAGFALYKLNSAFNTSKLPTTLKIARYHILLTARLLIDAGPLPRMNANEMEKRCTLMMDRLWNDADKLLSDAATRFSEIVAGNLDRDHIHTQGVTDSILEAFGNKKGQPS